MIEFDKSNSLGLLFIILICLLLFFFFFSFLQTNNEEEKFPDDSGIELMIPYHLGDFIARIVAKVILDGIDITDEYDLNLAS